LISGESSWPSQWCLLPTACLFIKDFQSALSLKDELTGWSKC
jgi:hypothetical protein